MEELKIVRRKNKRNSYKFNQPIMKLEIRQARFIVSKKVAKNLGLKESLSVMFAFNKKENCAYITEDKEPDAFKMKLNNVNTLRFSSQNLRNHFVDMFDLDEAVDNYFFMVDQEPNQKGLFKITLIKRPCKK